MENASELKKELKELGIIQTQLAEKCQVSKDYLNRVLNGREKMTLVMSVKIRTYIDLVKKSK